MSMKCIRCGRELMENERYCPNCGEYNGQGPSDKKEKKSILPIILVIGAGILVLVIAVVLAKMLLFNGSGEDAGQCVTYVKDGSLYSRNMDKIKKEGVEYPGSLGTGSFADLYGMAQISKDGKYLCYPSNYSDDDVYSFRLNVARVGKRNQDVVKIDSNVSSYRLLENNMILFQDTGDILYVSDLKGQKDKVASGVSYFFTDPEYKNIVWVENNGEYNDDIYVRDFKLKDQKTKLASDVSFKTINENMSRIYVMDEDDDLYVIENFGEKKRVDRDVEGILYGSQETEIYYYKSKEEKLTAADLIEDDYAAADATMREPKEEDYQKASLEQNYDGEYEKVMTTDWDAYDAAMEEWYAKESRDEMREEMTSYEIDTLSYELYRYDGKEQTLVDDDYLYVLGVDGSRIVYARSDAENIKKVRLSEVTSLYDVEEAFQDGQLNVQTACLYTGKKQIMLSENITSCWLDAASGKGYGLDDDGTLYRFGIKDDSDGSLDRIADDVYNVEGIFEGEVYYITDEKDGSGDLCRNGDIIDSDVTPESLYQVDKVLYYKTDSSSNGDYTLKSYDGRSNKSISDDVASEYVLDKKHVVLLTDFNYKRYEGDLQFYNGKDLRQIDEDVSCLIKNR